MSFNFRKQSQGQSDVRPVQKQSLNQNDDFQSKHNHKIQENTKTVVVSFIYKEKPDLNESKIVHILRNIIKDNPLELQPRIYGHKFYLSFTGKPSYQQIIDIRIAVQSAYPDCKVFAKLDEVTQKEKQTVYVGKLLGVDKNLLEEFLKQKQLSYKEVRITVDKQTGRPKNFGYIEFNDEKEALKAVGLLKDQKIGFSDGLKATMMVDQK